MSNGIGCTGAIFITDRLTQEYIQTHPPERETLNPKVVFLTEAPLFASLVSDQALKQIQMLQASDETTSPLSDHVDALSSTALRLSHAPSVAIVTSSPRDPGLSVKELCFVLSLTKALLALGKDVVLIAADDDDVSTWKEFIERSAEEGILNRHAQIIQVPHEKSRDSLYARIRALVPSLQSDLDLIAHSEGGEM